jgi:hypothetical protein
MAPRLAANDRSLLGPGARHRTESVTNESPALPRLPAQCERDL